MKCVTHRMLTMGLMALGLCCGCQSFGKTTGVAHTTVRGQNPGPISAGVETPNGRGFYHTPIRSAAEGAQDAYHEHHNTDTYYYSMGGRGVPAGYQGAPAMGGAEGMNCPPPGYAEGYGGMNCPPGYGGGYCPPGYGGGRNCQHGFHTGIIGDKSSYGYEVPNDLVYPPAGGVGGAVVYPYYTHKGPSDFFRQ